jgi:glycosyltransferase involved in cell wall biosynthesis/SAM-dependent methyltransferase
VNAQRLADALVLVFTGGVSLREWHDAGGLQREWALYHRLVPAHYPRMIAVTHGGADDLAIARHADLGAAVTIVCNDTGLERAAYEASVPARVRDLLGVHDAGRVLVKTNQFKGGGLAFSVAAELRAAGIAAALLARAGYHWSRHVARDEGSASPAAAEAAALEGELCRAADLVAVTTALIADDLRWRHALPEDRVRVVPNYVVDEAADASAAPAGAAMRIPGSVLVAGRLHPRKRVDLAIRAAAACPSLRTLTIVGDGPDRAALERLARDLRVPAVFTGRLDHHDLLDRMARTEVFLQCALFEGHPKTVLEAMATGAGVVVADTPGLGDVVRDNHTGVRVPFDPDAPNDASAARFAESLESLLTDHDLRTRLARAAARHVHATMSLSAVLPLELAAHRAALSARAEAERPAPALPPLRWDPALLTAPAPAAVAAFERGIHGFIKRLPVRRRCEFLFGLDWPLYQMQGMAAGELEGGLHPKHRLLRYHDFFVNRIRAGERVIDLGCGNGALMCSIASRAGGDPRGPGAHVTGIELNDATAAKARARAAEQGLADRVTVHHGDITTLRAPTPPGGFDALVLSNVLEHIDRRPERLAMWREWYSPRRWLIRVPAFDRDWRAPFKKELGVEWRLDVTHETEYTRDQLERELAQAGLVIDEVVVNWGEYWCSAHPTKDRS